MAPTIDASATVQVGTSSSSAVVDITSASVGAWVYVFFTLLGGITGPPTCTGWTAVTSDINIAILKRKKVSGDTTFTFAWPSTATGVVAFVSFNGLNATTAEEVGTASDYSGTTRTAVTTPSASPTVAGRYAVAVYGVKTTTSANAAISWTPDVSMTEIIDVNNSATASGTWAGMEVAISSAPLSTGAVTFTANHNHSETRDFQAVMFLIPAATVAATSGPGFFDGI